MARRRMTKQERTRQIYLRVCFVCALVAVLFTVLYVFLNDASKTTIDLKDVTHITLTGFDGEGVLTATVDVDEKYGAFYETVSVDFSKSSGLTNGDEVTISFKYDKNAAKTYNLKVKAGDMHYTVSGLVAATPVSENDLFEGLDINFEGIAPLATASLDASNTRFKDVVTYQIIDEKEYYDAGETIRVRAVFDAADLEKLDYKATVDSEECIKEYIVEDVDRYITDTDQITDEMMASLKKEALTLFTDANEYGMRIFCDAGLMPVYVNKKTTFKWSSPNYISSYLNVLREESYGKTGTHVNDIKLCYESVISQADGKACKAEVIVRFQDIIIRKDGTIDLKLESGEIISADRRDSHIKAIVRNEIDKDYESVKLTV
ncbi:MAG: hypothetical protein IKQ44_04275 [Lachnospiraceae bacterium]|nr:hypothetical protein [Lachnospiraceae bacterium]